MKWNGQGNFYQKGHAFSFSLKTISGPWADVLRSNASPEQSKNATLSQLMSMPFHQQYFEVREISEFEAF